MRLPRATPESMGVPSSALRSWYRRIEQQEIHSAMVVRRGAVIAEGWWKPFTSERIHQLFSLSKSFCSTAVGLAADEGLLSLDDRVVDHFPDKVPETVGENLRQMRIRDLLSMSCGHEVEAWNWSQFDPADTQASFLAHEVAHKPGQHFLYNSLGTYMCSAIVQRVTGGKVTEYLRPRLFEPLSIEEFPWDADPDGIEMGGWGLSVKTEDIAKFGLLYLQDGVWQGERLLPETWVAQASARQVENGDRGDSEWAQGYGFQFWRCRHNCYRGDGAFGQYCVVMPEQEAVVAITSSVDDMQAVLNAIWEELLPAMGDALPPGEHESLQTELTQLSLPTLDSNAEPIEGLEGRFVTEAGDPVAINLGERSVHIEVADAVDIVAGFGTWETGTSMGRDVAACCAWIDGGLEIKLRWLERTRGETWKLRIEDGRLVKEATVRAILGDAPPTNWIAARA